MNEREQVQKIEHDVYVSIKEHFKSLMEAQDRRVEQALYAAKEAVTKADTAQERRLDLLNEFRGQAADESKKYALKETVEAIEKQLSRFYGGMIVIGVIGVANLVKLWFVH